MSSNAALPWMDRMAFATRKGMHGYRLEVEAHIITASAATVDNLRQCVGAAGVEIQQFVLNPLASGEVVLTDQERQMGVAVCDIGGGTTDLAIYVNGDVWHTMVLAVGGNHVTQDIAHGLRLSFEQAEDVKKQQGYAMRQALGPKNILRSDRSAKIGPYRSIARNWLIS